ncbi:TfoX/Sxy family protein [Gilvimarinus polysaccharolyticus]|uniref:TfoX/Sxy family protein n=1 Tax=Gilvimarinus polysaccharolyticus TaxID=863921 RepID=UPI00067336A7|nr:TfoX/Sxy family protein [Gilvimarinus polysaccharolyticus]
MAIQRSELLELKNLGMASVNILRAIGVNNYDDLQQLGAVNAYCRILERNINVSKVMLYALHGALLDIHWNDLPADVKANLVKQVEDKQTANA